MSATEGVEQRGAAARGQLERGYVGEVAVGVHLLVAVVELRERDPARPGSVRCSAMNASKPPSVSVRMDCIEPERSSRK